MDVFFRVFNQMAMMALLIIVGFVLRKIRIVPENTGATLSKLETFAICPALNFCTQVRYCTVENFSKYYSLILYGTIICVIAVVISYPLSKLFVRNYKENDVAAYQRNVYKYGLTFGNFGFIGDFLVLGVFGGEIFFTFKMFTLGMSIICTVWGLYVLIPKVGAKSGILTNLKAGLLAPPTLATLSVSSAVFWDSANFSARISTSSPPRLFRKPLPKRFSLSQRLSKKQKTSSLQLLRERISSLSRLSTKQEAVWVLLQ